MAILYADILEHNNQTKALMDSSQLRGSAYVVGTLSETGSIPSDKWNYGMIIYASSSAQHYGFFGPTTSSADWNNSTYWKAFSTGSGGGGTGAGFPYSGSAVITGSLLVSGSGVTITGSLNVYGGITGSLQGTASYAISSSYATTASYVQQAQTASYVLNAISSSYSTYAQTAGNGGVTQLVAGANISVSPAGGTGVVTVSALGGTNSNTATGSYGAFHDTGSYPITNTTTVYSASFSSTDVTNGVYISGSDRTRVFFANAGIYNVQFSAQFENSDNTDQDVQIWLRQGNDGLGSTDVPYTTGLVSVPSKHGSVNGHTIASWNYYVSAANNDYLQLMYQGSSTGITLITYAAGTNPTTPITPATILTANRVDLFLSNTGSFSGSFTGTLTGTATSASYAATASYAPSYVLTSTTSSFATTSSNTFIGNQTITGSVNVNNSGSFTNSLQILGNGFLYGSSTNHYITLAGGSITISNPVGGNTYFSAGGTQYGGVINSGGRWLLGPSTFVEDGVSKLQVSGSGKFTNNLVITGSLNVLGGITGSLSGSATSATSASYATTASYVQTAQTASYILNAVSSSYATTASYALNGGGGAAFPYSGTAVISGSLLITGSGLTVTGSVNIGPSTITTSTVTSVLGSNTIFSQPTGSYTSAFYKYTFTSQSNARAGEVMAIWNGTSVQFTDNSTPDIGNTSAVTSSVSISGANVVLSTYTPAAGWTIKSYVTYI